MSFTEEAEELSWQGAGGKEFFKTLTTPAS